MSDNFGTAAANAGAGNAGRNLSLVGVAAYVVPATIAYATIGSTALDRLAALLRAHPLTGTILAAVGVGFALAGPGRFESALAGRLIRQVGCWLTGVSVAVYLTGSAQLVVTLTTFVAGVLLANTRKVTEGPRSSLALETSHRTSLAGLTLQLVLMTVLAAGVTITIFVSNAGIATPVLIGDLSGTSIIRTVGVLAFAAVGTGHACLYVYPAMRSATFRRRTVDISLRFVIGLELVWIIIVAFAVEPSTLLTLDSDRATSAQGLSDIITSHAGFSVGIAAAVVAQLAILIGVTNAASGFTESLALEAIAGMRRSQRLRKLPATVTLKRTLLGVSALAAAAIELCNIPASLVLALSGLVGGGVLLFVLPALAEQNPNRVRRAGIEAQATAVIVGVSGTLTIALEGAPTAVTALSACVFCIPLILAIQSARNMRSCRSTTLASTARRARP